MWDERIAELVRLYEMAFPERGKVSADTLIRGTTIGKLCEYDGGGYKRVHKWLEDKIAENQASEVEEQEMQSLFDDLEVEPEIRGYDFDKVKKSVELFLEGLGIDFKNDLNSKETPERVAKMWQILAGGYNIDPVEILKTFPSNSSDMVTLTNIPFYSFCSHHLLPFIGKLHIAYIPQGKVVGISKLVRFARVYAKRLNLQEDLTQDIANVLMTQLNAGGVMVKMEASHFCMTLRGVRSQGAVMVTTAKRGSFILDGKLQEEFQNSLRDSGTFNY